MTITVELPDDLAHHPDPAREALETLAVECYRTGALTQRQAAAILDLYWLDFEGLLKQRGVVEGAYDEAALQRDIQSADRSHQAIYVPA